MSWAAAPFILLIRAYQALLRPFMGGQCRYHPTCSEYAIAAYKEHGPWRGSWLTVHRLCRCHPLARGGFDPPPPRRNREDRSK